MESEISFAVALEEAKHAHPSVSPGERGLSFWVFLPEQGRVASVVFNGQRLVCSCGATWWCLHQVAVWQTLTGDDLLDTPHVRWYARAHEDTAYGASMTS